MSRVWALIVGAVTVAVAAAGADAAFPGQNGKIAFIRNGAIYLIEPDGSGLTALTKETLSAPAQDPAWSPDGSQIAFARACGIYVMNADGSNVRTIAKPGKPCSYEPAWSPDGSKLVFTKKTTAGLHGVSGVYTMRANGTGQRLISQKTLGRRSYDDAFPQWSPDGRRIVFARNAFSGSIPATQIWIMNTNGSAQKRLTKERIAVGENMPVWSPDGKQIAYMKRKLVATADDEVRFITIANAVSGAMRDLPAGKIDQNPAWSPDGARIVVAAEGLTILNTDGKERKLLTDRLSDDAPDWQPTR